MYNIIYKCRMCGQEYKRSASGDYIDNIIVSQQLDNEVIPNLIDIHACDNDDFGIADLIGFKHA